MALKRDLSTSIYVPLEDGIIEMFKGTNKPGRFISDNNLVLDFRHIIKYCRIYETSFVLEHWNRAAKKWGYFDFSSNDYYLVEVNQLSQPFPIVGERLSMPFSTTIKPTNVILFRDCYIEVKRDGFLWMKQSLWMEEDASHHQTK